jgi:hypothetical protein
LGRSFSTLPVHSISGSASIRSRTVWPTATRADSISSTSPWAAISVTSVTSMQGSSAQQGSPTFFFSPRQLVK